MTKTKSADDRLRKYSDKLIPTRVQNFLTLWLPNMIDSFGEVANELNAIREHVWGILSGELVVLPMYARYLAFANQVYSCYRKYGGGSGTVEWVAQLVAKWMSRGCEEPILNKIRDEVFAIPAPAGP